jgi:hypothetical protein
MSSTYEPIATTTLGSTGNITFTSIASSWTDLRIALVGITNSGFTHPAIRFNSDTGSNYSNTRLNGNGSSATSANGTSQTRINGTTDIGTPPAFYLWDVFSYAGSTYKTVLLNANSDQNGSGTVERLVGLWRSTSAITSISVFDLYGTGFGTGTTATLYGIKNA